MNTTVEKDFGDWLSPMLVKEIRQALRSRGFILPFLLIQALMIFCVAMGVVSPEGFNGLASALFWMNISGILLIIIPCCGFPVLQREIKEKTLELLFLTRLTAGRIVFGKWLALFVQSLLIVCAVLPYTFLLYFIGGVNLLDELNRLLVTLFYSAMFTALTVTLSSFRNLFARLVIAFVAMFVGGIFQGMAGAAMFSGFSLGTLILMLIAGPLFIMMMMGIATARIDLPNDVTYEFNRDTWHYGVADQ